MFRFCLKIVWYIEMDVLGLRVNQMTITRAAILIAIFLLTGCRPTNRHKRPNYCGVHYPLKIKAVYNGVGLAASGGIPVLKFN